MSASFVPDNSSLNTKLGFDTTVSPPWVMVPNDPARPKPVMLKDGAGLTLKLARTGVVSFQELSPTPDGRRIQLTGASPGSVVLTAQDSAGKVQASLEVTVKATKRLATFIHFVFDKSHRSSTRGLTEALQVMDVANQLLLPQVNVTMFRRDSGGFYLPFDLPKGVPIPVAFNVPRAWIKGPGQWPCFSKDPPGPQGCMPPAQQGALPAADFEGIRINNILANILAHADPASDYNIFFVNRLDDPSAISPTGAYTLSNIAGAILNSCIIPDVSRGHALAHEVGHYLLQGAKFLSRTGHTTEKEDLMTDSPNPWDIRIRRQSADVMNPSGAASSAP